MLAIRKIRCNKTIKNPWQGFLEGGDICMAEVNLSRHLTPGGGGGARVQDSLPF